MKCNARDCEFRTVEGALALVCPCDDCPCHHGGALPGTCLVEGGCERLPRPVLTQREQLAEHAAMTGHALCLVCRRSLAPFDVQTCEGCLTEFREVLATVVTLWMELPMHLGQLPGVSGGGTRPAADGRPLPGGDVLVLLGPGSEGLSETGETTRDGDATSVAFDLTWWEADWRQERREAAPKLSRLGSAVRRAAGYLEVHARWAAQQHPGFDDCLSDLLILHERLERATGRTRRAARANAACFDCGGQLIRRVDPATGQEQDHVTCDRPGCRRVYTPAQYTLALRAVRESGLQGWVPIRDAAEYTRRSVDTLESWAKRGLVTSCCALRWTAEGLPVLDRKLVWWPDVAARVDASKPRVRAS